MVTDHNETVELGRLTQDEVVDRMLAAVREQVCQGMGMGAILDLMAERDGQPEIVIVVGRGRAVAEWLGDAVTLIRFKLKEREGAICQYCGCTEDVACEGGCAWHAEGVCNHPQCVKRYEAEQREAEARAQGRTS